MGVYGFLHHCSCQKMINSSNSSCSKDASLRLFEMVCPSVQRSFVGMSVKPVEESLFSALFSTFESFQSRRCHIPKPSLMRLKKLLSWSSSKSVCPSICPSLCHSCSARYSAHALCDADRKHTVARSVLLLIDPDILPIRT